MALPSRGVVQWPGPRHSRPLACLVVGSRVRACAPDAAMLPPESVGGVRDLATVTPLVVIGAGRAALALVSRLPEAQLAGCLGACCAACARRGEA